VLRRGLLLAGVAGVFESSRDAKGTVLTTTDLMRPKRDIVDGCAASATSPPPPRCGVNTPIGSSAMATRRP
jgi:hypothetical protein